jgi:CNT family concentrative nucleoside transporter
LPTKFIGFIGIFAMIGCAYVISNNRKAINWRPVFWGIGLQIIFAILILHLKFGQIFFSSCDRIINSLLSYADAGTDFILRSFVTGTVDPPVLNLAFRTLPTIIFFSSFMAILYHLRIMGFIISTIAMIMQKTMKTSGAETLSTAANIFVGQTEAPLVVRPFIKSMTQSELMAVMTGGFATVAGGVMAIYVSLLRDQVPGIAGHLLAASVMSAPAALAISKIIIPETETPATSAANQITIEQIDQNVLEAASRGATDGMRLTLNVAAMLIAFVALVALVNGFLSLLNLSLEQLLGYLFYPFAILMGIPFSEATQAGRLLGEKLVLTEFIAYTNLSGIMASPNPLSQKSAVILSYALCGFSNFASIGVQLGGIGGIAPERRTDLAKIGFRAMIAGVLAANMTATIAGILYKST